MSSSLDELKHWICIHYFWAYFLFSSCKSFVFWCWFCR